MRIVDPGMGGFVADALQGRGPASLVRSGQQLKTAATPIATAVQAIAPARVLIGPATAPASPAAREVEKAPARVLVQSAGRMPGIARAKAAAPVITMPGVGGGGGAPVYEPVDNYPASTPSVVAGPTTHEELSPSSPLYEEPAIMPSAIDGAPVQILPMNHAIRGPIGPDAATVSVTADDWMFVAAGVVGLAGLGLAAYYLTKKKR